MIKNETKHINPDEIANITAQAKTNNFYLVNLDGREIHNEQDYIIAIYKGFILPEEYTAWDWKNYQYYYEVITDLDWLIDAGYAGFGLIIDYYKSFLAKNNPDFKQLLKLNEEGFNAITKYWESEIVELDEGTAHPFNIYLVDR